MSVRALGVACQGGGSHCAFSAGVMMEFLSRLDDELCLTRHGERYRIVGLSGTSGGAINALMAWYGLIHPSGPEAGVFALEGFWRDIGARTWSDAAANFWTVHALRLREILPHLESAPGVQAGWALQRMRELLGKHVPFSRLAAMMHAESPKLLIGAANVQSGAFKVFGCDREVPVLEHILASTAVPTFYQAVEIDGVPYWDGLLSQNPPVRDFLRDCTLDDKPDEIWVIRINPRGHHGLPTRMVDIVDRQNEMAGNLSLEQEYFFIDQVNQWLQAGQLTGPYKTVECREIALEAMSGVDGRLDYASKLDRDPAFLAGLIELGRLSARNFLDAPAA